MSRLGVPMYNYYWGMTAAQIELMTVDCPLLLYDRKDKTPKHSKKEMDELTRRWKAKRRGQEEKGIKLNINDFLRKGGEALPNE